MGGGQHERKFMYLECFPDLHKSSIPRKKNSKMNQTLLGIVSSIPGGNEMGWIGVVNLGALI